MQTEFKCTTEKFHKTTVRNRGHSLKLKTKLFQIKIKSCSTDAISK